MSLKKILGGAFGSIISKNYYRIYMSKQEAECILRRMEGVERAQDQLARAMTQYAVQLKSHTDAIEGLSKASRELTKSAIEQSKFLTHLTKLIEQPSVGAEHIILESEEKSEVKNMVFPPGCYRRRL
jgi:hypothetical protein